LAGKSPSRIFDSHQVISPVLNKIAFVVTGTRSDRKIVKAFVLKIHGDPEKRNSSKISNQYDNPITSEVGQTFDLNLRRKQQKMLHMNGF